MDLEELDEFVTRNFNELVKSSTLEMSRLVGYLETDEDFYYRIKTIRNNEVVTVLESCVGSLSVVSEELTDREYQELNKEYLKILPAEKEILKRNEKDTKLIRPKY